MSLPGIGAAAGIMSNDTLEKVLTSTTNVNIQNLFTSLQWSSANLTKRVVIPAGVTIGSTSSSVPALRTGTGRQGSLQIVVNGVVYGAGGAANSGVGGDGLYIDQACQLYGNGQIYGGGGGGGAGGYGGPGYYTGTHIGQDGPVYSFNQYMWEWDTVQHGAQADYFVMWAGAQAFFVGGVSPTTAQNTTAYTSGAYTYYRYSYVTGNSDEGTDSAYYYVYRQYAVTDYYYTSGGAGGAGGAGQGYNQNRGAGSAGGAGGTNAGTGGTGGAGGVIGNYGGTGATGASGNNGSGGAGSAGGAPGYSIRNIGSLTVYQFTGTLAGLT